MCIADVVCSWWEAAGQRVIHASSCSPHGCCWDGQGVGLATHLSVCGLLVWMLSWCTLYSWLQLSIQQHVLHGDCLARTVRWLHGRA